MKKSWKMLLSLCLVTALLLSLCACGDDEAADAVAPAQAASEPTAAPMITPEPTATPEPAPKTAAGIGVCGDYEYEYYTDGTACIIKYSGRETVVVIPSELDGYPVTTIGEEAFSHCTSLTSITIPEGVTTIGSSAFFWCTSLTAVTIPDSVTTIGDRAFYNCESLTAVTIPSSVTAIGNGAFFGCYNLTLTITRDSYAEQYCKDNGIAYQYADAYDWLLN